MNDIQEKNEIENPNEEFQGRLYIDFSITGINFSPDEITARLGIQPESSFKYGDIRVNSNEEEQVRKRSSWSISSDNKGLPSNDPIPHFEWLLEILEPVASKIKEILFDKYLDGCVSCFWITPDGRINLEVEPDMIARFARLNLKVWFDVYCNH